jgi:putative endonuclease
VAQEYTASLLAVIASRYRSPQGEIDSVAVRRQLLAVIEVKARRTRDAALQSLQARQRQPLERVGNDFLARHSRYARYDIHFDVMTVTP